MGAPRARAAGAPDGRHSPVGRTHRLTGTGDSESETPTLVASIRIRLFPIGVLLAYTAVYIGVYGGVLAYSHDELAR